MIVDDVFIIKRRQNTDISVKPELKVGKINVLVFFTKLQLFLLSKESIE
jgi:hypothetical protein